MPISESEIIEQAIAGDVRAFRRLVEKHQTFVLRLAYRFVRNVGDAEDIAQDVFIRLWKNLYKYKPDIKLSTWLYTIVTNRCLDYLKSSQSKVSRTATSVEEELTINANVASDSAVLNEEMRIAILKLADDLTPKQKAVFVLRDLEELDVDEVCRILNESPANIKSNLFHARQKMADLIRKYYGINKNETL